MVVDFCLALIDLASKGSRKNLDSLRGRYRKYLRSVIYYGELLAH